MALALLHNVLLLLMNPWLDKQSAENVFFDQNTYPRESKRALYDLPGYIIHTPGYELYLVSIDSGKEMLRRIVKRMDGDDRSSENGTTMQSTTNKFTAAVRRGPT